MLHSIRFRLPASVLAVAAALPLVLLTGALGEEAVLTPIPDSYAADDQTKENQSPCSCRSGDRAPEENKAQSFEIVEFLHPRWSSESLREGEDFALVYADVPELKPDLYLLRVYASGEKALATLVDDGGNETPFEAEFAVFGERSVRLYVDALGLGAPTDGGLEKPDPPTELELDLICGDDNWILVVWRNDDGSVGWDAECL